MPKIQRLWAREILDSRGTPTVEAACQLDNGAVAASSVPSGASTGSYEALELRDGDENRYHGKGVLNAVANINQVIGPALIREGFDPMNQQQIDQFLLKLDGTENKSKLGANSILAVSEAVTKVASLVQGQPLYQWINRLARQMGLQPQMHVPAPIFNMINGGLHGAGNLDFQEFHVIPASFKTFSEGLRMGVEIYKVLGSNLASRGAIHSVGDEGGYAPNLFTNADAFEILIEAIRKTTYQMGRDVFLGLDVAASTFYKNGGYTIRDKTTAMNEASFIEYYKALNAAYHFALIEDPLHEDAWGGWHKVKEELGEQVSIVGDDLLATNMKRVQKAIQEKACNAILIKPNQVGTVTETLQVVKMARDAGWKVVVSHRSGETNDYFIADFSVGVGADYAKFGAPARGERIVKYNRLSAIEAELSASQHGSPQQ